MKYYNKAGQEINAGQWLYLFEDRHYRQVRYTEANGSVVSTVWIGYDRRGNRKIFETLVRGRIQRMTRTSTLEEAIGVHELCVEETSHHPGTLSMANGRVRNEDLPDEDF